MTWTPSISDGLEGMQARPQGVHETRMETEAEPEKRSDLVGSRVPM